MSSLPPCNGQNAGHCTPTELQKQQLDYAWNWFCFHADQRIKVYNFMLVALGFLVAAIVTAVDKDRLGIALVLCLFSALLAVAFVALDRRNRDLERLGADVLRELEKTVLFEKAGTATPSVMSSLDAGILANPKHEAGYSDKGALVSIENFVLGKHRLLLPATAWLFFLLFLGGALHLGSELRQPKRETSPDSAAVKVYCSTCPSNSPVAASQPTPVTR